MRTLAVALVAAAFFALTASHAYAMKFSFDPSSGLATKPAGSPVPVAIVVVASLVGGLLIVLERKKARGIWFSDSGKMR